MTFDEASGVWSYTTSTDWNYDYYRYQVDVYSPYTGVVEANTVTDPYSVSLSVNTFDVNNEQPLNDQCSQVIDLLNDPVLKPSGWDTLSKPALPAPEDISVYELHVRDFSVFDTSVTDADHRGTYKAFTYDGNGNPLSDGMSHLIDLANAGLTHIHLLPVADSGIMVEDANQRAEPDFNALETAVSGDPATDDAADAAANTRSQMASTGATRRSTSPRRRALIPPTRTARPACWSSARWCNRSTRTTCASSSTSSITTPTAPSRTAAPC